jgi:hypothetical protein
MGGVVAVILIMMSALGHSPIEWPIVLIFSIAAAAGGALVGTRLLDPQIKARGKSPQRYGAWAVVLAFGVMFVGDVIFELIAHNDKNLWRTLFQHAGLTAWFGIMIVPILALIGSFLAAILYWIASGKCREDYSWGSNEP